MKAVRRKDTAPEMTVRRALHSLGYRYRLHGKGLPGSPDLVFSSRKKVIFVHGCFWHSHDCPSGALPKSRLDYWGPKIARNVERDHKSICLLRKSGWETMVVWECETKNLDELLPRLTSFLGPSGEHCQATMV